jgi:cell division protein FtsI/penicillin-binding protein 2
VVEEPVPGKDVVLTIDRYLQRLAEERLAAAIEEHEAKGGTIIIMDPHSGEILALASAPSFKFSTLDLDDPNQQALLRNRAVTDLYEPGSVMKVVTAAAAIDRGVVSPDTTYIDNGYAQIYDVTIKNWDDNVYGPQTMTGVLQHSINTGAIFMAEKLGATAFQEYLDAFGFGRLTGIELQGEASGIFRRPDDAGWSVVDLATQSFGQAISVTPLQMISAIATVVNGGNLVKPHLVRSIVDADGKQQVTRPEIVGRAISGESSATLRQMLEAVVYPGWVHPGQPRDYIAGGKSGTANVPVSNGYDDTQIASFVGFAPASDPRVVILVKLDENADLETGTQAAAPVVAGLIDETLHYLNVPTKDASRVAAYR